MENDKEGIKSYRIALNFLVVGLIIISFITMFALIELKVKIDENKDFQQQIMNLKTTIQEKDSMIQGLNITLQGWKNAVKELQKVDLHICSFRSDYNEPLILQHYAHVYGVIVNYGNDIAGNVVIGFTVYNSNHVVIANSAIAFDSISGRGYAVFDTNINYYGHASTTEFSILYIP